MDKQQSISIPSIRRNPSHKHQSQQPILPTKFKNFTKTKAFPQNTFVAQPITKHSTTFILFKSRKYKTHTYNEPLPRLNLQWKNHHKPSRRPKASLSQSQLWLAFTFGIFKLFYFIISKIILPIILYRFIIHTTFHFLFISSFL